MDLTTTYLGLELEHPVVASAGPLSSTLEGIKRLEEGGASAIVLFSLFYARALSLRSSGRLWIVYLTDRVERSGESIPIERLTSEWRDQALGRKWYARILRVPRLWIVALAFSISSAFAIGWRDLNFGNWFARIQPREYLIRPTGWTRTLSGIQAIVSVYLLALWVLTYFGQPFDY